MIADMTGEALLTNISSLASHDGPGLRTTLFFKGCSLRCRWCHNPETIRKVREIEWNRRLCIGCHTCETHCESGAIDFSAQRDYPVDKKRCTQCFVCAANCPAQALKVVGQAYSVEALDAMIRKDEPLIRAMSGGVTFSGGEPALQAAFIVPLSQRLKERGVHLALDTCGMAPWENYRQLLPYMDLILFDLKEMDPDKHIEFTGKDNRLIHENVLRMTSYIHSHQLPARIWIRTPLIPGMTATKENMTAIGTFIDASLSDYVDKWELCAFNNMCNDKYERLGIHWSLKAVDLLTEAEMGELLTVAKRSAPSVREVTASGLNRK